MKPDLSKLSIASERVKKLRECYFNNSPMVVNRELVPWKCSHSLYLYTEGWLNRGYAPTVKLRRAEAERYMLERTKPVIIPGELIVGQPDFSPFTDEEAEKYKHIMLFRPRAAEPTTWRSIIRSSSKTASKD